MNYTAESLVNKLREEEGVSISVRTLNYYAYDKKMFPNLGKGKCSFTDKEYEMLKRITYLKDKTSMSLDEIRECIANDKEYDKQVDNVVTDAVSRSKTYSVATNETYSASTTNEPMTVSMRGVTTHSDIFVNSVSSDLPYSNLDKTESMNEFMNSCSSQNFVSSSSLSCDGIAFADDGNYETSAQNTCNTYQSTTLGYSNATGTSAKDSLGGTFIVPMPTSTMLQTETKKAYEEKDTTVRINKDVTITVSSDVSRERLIEIINFINSK